MTDKRFPSPFEVEPPQGDIAGWEEMYPYSVTFGEGRREYEESRFWFQDSMHWGDAMTPWDSTLLEFALGSLSQFNSRHYRIPPADGIDCRVLYGYPYFSPVEVAPENIEARVPQFMERAGHYFMNWDDLYQDWLVKVKANIDAIDAIDFSPLTEVEDLDVITSGQGTGAGLRLTKQYHEFKDLVLQTWQYHFEFLNLGYAAYLDFFGFCKQVWPTIPDLSVARMVAGVDVDLFKPDEKLKELAQLAVDSGMARVFDVPDDLDAINDVLATTDSGRAWKAAWDEASDPWFNFSSGNGFYHYDKVWIDYPEIPYAFIRDYITKLEEGVDISRPVEKVIAERDRIVSEYMELLDSDEDRETFQGKLGLARVVFPYVENHNFYIEHWTMSRFWKKLRELGDIVAEAGIIEDAADIVYIKRDEIDEVIWDMYSSWAANAPAAGGTYWPAKITQRKGWIDTFREWKAPKALGAPPEVITEPFTIMLWGITSESVNSWLGMDDTEGTDLQGMAASPGVVEGPARLVFKAEDIAHVQDGEILVAPITTPSWAPIFPKIKACVTDIGGMMSHAAIVCREYGVPAVTGTGYGTDKIKNGDMIRVDGSTGTVEFL